MWASVLEAGFWRPRLPFGGLRRRSPLGCYYFLRAAIDFSASSTSSVPMRGFHLS